MPLVRTRLAMGLISASVVGLELGLMRWLALRWWHHFAYMIISVALLGFGASGVALTLTRGRMLARRRGWVCMLAIAMSLSIPVCTWASGLVPLNVYSLAWDLSQLGNVALLEALIFIPFLLAGGAIGLVLTDRPERIGGHYAANLIGSGVGASMAVALMHVVSAGQLSTVMAVVSCAAAVVLLRWRRAVVPLAVIGGVVLGLLAFAMPHQPIMSQYKMLSHVRRMDGTETIHQADGPLGKIDVVTNQAIHHVPGLSLQWTGDIPPSALLILDGDQTSAIYDCPQVSDWAFTDYMTSAAAYHLGSGPSALIIGAGGGGDIGCAIFHLSSAPGRSIVALEMNGQVIRAMKGPLADISGRVYLAEGLEVVAGEARGYLASTGRRFDIIQLPPIDAGGASGAGLLAAQESYLYTVQAVGEMLKHLTDRGVLCITRWARVPPRDGLRAFDIAAEALKAAGLSPAERLAMIRSFSTVTVLVSNAPLTVEQQDRLRAFCDTRGFDLCYLPNITVGQVNRRHVLDRPYYFEAARGLLGPGRKAFLAEYLFDVEATTDDKPYYFNYFRWRAWPELRRQLKARSRTFLEKGEVMLLAALVQSVVLAGGLILLPLMAGARSIRAQRRKIPTLVYFFLLGGGFMLLEMGFLQKLILYLAHPIYSAATVITGFLIFAGLGSQLSGRWSGGGRRIMATAAAAVAGISLAYIFALDVWLGLTQDWTLWVRMIIAAGTIAPLGVAMGHMFPIALRQVGRTSPALVPWTWGVNGFASVGATVAAPLAAMSFGFARLTLIAIACYVVAGLVAQVLPATEAKPPAHAG